MKTRLKKHLLGLLVAGLLLVTPVMTLAATINFSGIDDYFNAQFDATVAIEGSTVTEVSFTINGGEAIVLANLTQLLYTPGVSLNLKGNSGGAAPSYFALDYYCNDPDGFNRMFAMIDSATYLVTGSKLTASGASCVPLPGSLLILGSGLAGLLGLRRKP